MASDPIDLPALLAAQVRWTAEWHAGPPSSSAEGFAGLVQDNHWQNFCLWHEEDQARRDDAGPAHVCRAKRAIDRHNQLRNDAVERIDAALLELLPPAADAPLHSETPGMMLDRCSILALKEYHMAEQVDRREVPPVHRESCAARLAVIREQRSDLGALLARFLDELERGERAYKVYFQFKMYNDPLLNPELYRRRGGAPA